MAGTPSVDIQPPAARAAGCQLTLDSVNCDGRSPGCGDGSISVRADGRLGYHTQVAAGWRIVRVEYTERQTSHYQEFDRESGDAVSEPEDYDSGVQTFHWSAQPSEPCRCPDPSSDTASGRMGAGKVFYDYSTDCRSTLTVAHLDITAEILSVTAYFEPFCCCHCTGYPLYNPGSGEIAFMPDSGGVAGDYGCEGCP